MTEHLASIRGNHHILCISAAAKVIRFTSGETSHRGLGLVGLTLDFSVTLSVVESVNDLVDIPEHSVDDWQSTRHSLPRVQLATISCEVGRDAAVSCMTCQPTSA